MADNIVDISILCPLKFVKEGYTRPAPYNTPYMEDYIYQETIPDFYEQQDYKQPWQKNDAIPIQIQSNYAPHQLELYDCEGNQVSGGIFVMSYVPSSIEGIGVKVYEAVIALNDFEEGVYFFRLKCGSPVLETYRSEYFDLKQKHDNTILFKYKHDENDHDGVFETGIEFSFRVHGGFPPEEYKPGSNRTVFIDQPNNLTQLSGKSFEIEKLLLGDSFGLPKWVIQKINQIFLCSQVLIDGKQYVANEGANVEPNKEPLYPMAGWALDVRPAKNPTKKRFVADGSQGSPLTIVYNIESKGFGAITQEASTNIIQVQSLD